HTRQRLARPSSEDRDLVLRVHAAFARVKRRLEALRADAIAIVAGDHVEAFFLDGVPALAVYVGTECAGTFGRYRYRFPIDEPLARAVVEQGVERGFDLFYTQHAPLDYAFYVPLHFTMPEPARADRAAPRERVPAAPAHAAPVPRLGPGARRDPPGATGADRPDGLGRHVALPGDRSLRVTRVRVRSPAAGNAEGRPRPRAGRDHRGGA